MEQLKLHITRILSKDIPYPLFGNGKTPKYQGILDQVAILTSGEAIKVASVSNSIIVTFYRYAKRHPIVVIRRSVGNGRYDMYLTKKANVK